MSNDDRVWIDQLWAEMRPRAQEKVRALMSAVAVNGERGLTPQQRADSCRLAQQLSGSLGGYGFGDGAAAAAELEAILGGEGPIDQTRAEEAVGRLQASID